MIPITIYTKTDIGKQRETNEDSVASLVLNSVSNGQEFNYGVLVVADGMGGREMGEVASDLATNKFIKEISDSILNSPLEKENIKFSEIISKAVEVANKEVWELSKKKSNQIGTTLVGAIIVDRHVYIVNVGDSRAYLVSKKAVSQITKDHSVVQEMLDGKMITKEQAKHHPRKNIITKALGLEENVKADVFEVDMNQDTLMLCSDGLSNLIDEKEISKAMKGDIQRSADALITLANKNGGWDNISIAVARYGI